MVERWKIDAARDLKRLVNRVEDLTDELERHNDLRERELEDDGDT